MTGGAVRVGIWAVALVLGIGLSGLILFGLPTERSMTDDIGQGDYHLTTSAGGDFTEATLRGAPSLVFFGFTNCPDVCPTTLADIATWQDGLGPLADGLRVFFVTVDPERDTAPVLAEYVGWLPGATGVTGTPDEVAKAIAAFKIYAARVPEEDGGYSMDHSAYVMLFDADGRFDQIFAYGEDPDHVVGKLRQALNG